MGFWEVFKNLKTILQNLNFCKKDILDFHRMRYTSRLPRFQYVLQNLPNHIKYQFIIIFLPSLGLEKNRVYDIKRYVRKLYTILPFEKAFAKYNCNVAYLGHPLLDAISTWKKEQNQII